MSFSPGSGVGAHPPWSYFGDGTADCSSVSAVTPDLVAHRYGGQSPEYLESALSADDCVEQVVEAFDDGDTTFIVSSDHGHIQRRGGGGHGGLEPEVVNAPTVLFGRAVHPGKGWRGRQVDIAPTISALLGLPNPRLQPRPCSLGRDRGAPDGVRQELRRREDQQREFVQANQPAASRRAEREGTNRFPGLIMIVALAVGVAGWNALPRPRSAKRAALGLAAYYGIYYVLFWAFGLGYSLSLVGGEDAAWWFVARNVAAVIPAFIGSVWVVAHASRTSPRNALLGAALLISATLVGQVGVIHWKSGLFMVRSLPNMYWFMKAHLDLIQLGVVGGAASALFVLTASIRTARPA